MRHLTTLLLLAFSHIALADDALLSWTSDIDPDEFVIHHNVNGIDQPNTSIAGTLREYTVPNLENGVHVFSASAVKDGQTSLRSNQDGAFILNLTITVSVNQGG